jgi:hypothetical protein
MRLWLDDLRTMPTDFHVHVKSAWTAISLLKTGIFTEVSLDHDLGFDEVEHRVSRIAARDGGENTGLQVAQWIEKAATDGSLKRLRWRVHSNNEVGVELMEAALRRADACWDSQESGAKSGLGHDLCMAGR